MGKELPKRNFPRLKNYDYSSCGGYFITICTKEKRNYFWCSVGATIGRPKNVELSPYGQIAEEAINKIPEIYPSVRLDGYVIMPDHIHLLLVVCSDEFGRPMVAPTMSRVVKQTKGYVTKRIGKSIWQKLFVDHIIRNREDYEKHLRYIKNNPIKWYYRKIKTGENMKKVEIYTDGSCKKNPGPGGWAAVLVYNGREKEICGGEAETTNNRMELLATINALKALKEPCEVVLTSDSKYVVDGISKGWARGWKARGWKKADKSPALNPELWDELLTQCDRHEIEFVWVKGHAGHPYNERCDTLAQGEAEKYR